MNNKLIFALFCVLLASATALRTETAQGYNVDQATNALEQLVNDAQNNLADLENNWAVNQPLLQAAIDNLNQQVENKEAECRSLENTLNEDQAQLDNANNYVAWLNRRVQENLDKINELLSNRCTQSNNYVDSLKNDKVALSPVQFLTQQVQSKTSFDFAQRKSFMNRLHSFLAIYKRGSIGELVELQKQVASDYEVNVDTTEQARSDEEVGTGHVDNNRGELDLDQFQSGERQDWAAVQAQFLQILNDLENTINQKIQNAQNDEVASGVAAAELKRQYEHEISVFNAELAKWNNTVLTLQATVANDTQNLNTCNQQVSDLRSQLSSAVSDLETATAQFNHKQANFQEEVQVFNEVLELYQSSTGSQGSDFKARADDYLDDQTFQNGSYDAREVDEIDLLNQGSF